MALFGKKESSTTTDPHAAETETLASIIDAQMEVVGNISFKGKTKIDGTVNGNINGTHLIIGQTGEITGDITASSIVCYGSINGKIKADLFTAGATCKLNGHLDAGDLSIESGASLKVEIRLGNKQPKLIDQEPAAATNKAD